MTVLVGGRAVTDCAATVGNAAAVKIATEDAAAAAASVMVVLLSLEVSLVFEVRTLSNKPGKVSRLEGWQPVLHGKPLGLR